MVTGLLPALYRSIAPSWPTLMIAAVAVVCPLV
jgi:hypothetical protein